MATPPPVDIPTFSRIPPSQKEIYEAAKVDSRNEKRKANKINDKNEENPSKFRKVLFRKPFPNLEVIDIIHQITEYSVEESIRNASALKGRDDIRDAQNANGENVSNPFPGF
jgi:hypothetical protein